MVFVGGLGQEDTPCVKRHGLQPTPSLAAAAEQSNCSPAASRQLALPTHADGRRTGEESRLLSSKLLRRNRFSMTRLGKRGNFGKLGPQVALGGLCGSASGFRLAAGKPHRRLKLPRTWRRPWLWLVGRPSHVHMY